MVAAHWRILRAASLAGPLSREGSIHDVLSEDRGQKGGNRGGVRAPNLGGVGEWDEEAHGSGPQLVDQDLLEFLCVKDVPPVENTKRQS